MFLYRSLFHDKFWPNRNPSRIQHSSLHTAKKKRKNCFHIHSTELNSAAIWTRYHSNAACCVSGIRFVGPLCKKSFQARSRRKFALMRLLIKPALHPLRKRRHSQEPTRARKVHFRQSPVPLRRRGHAGSLRQVNRSKDSRSRKFTPAT